jgi:hypothetical protein
MAKLDKRKPLHKVASRDVEGERLRDLTPTPLQAARVKLIWFARAMEDGTSIEVALGEAYRGLAKEFAKDIRTVLVHTRGE